MYKGTREQSARKDVYSHGAYRGREGARLAVVVRIMCRRHLMRERSISDAQNFSFAIQLIRAE